MPLPAWTPMAALSEAPQPDFTPCETTSSTAGPGAMANTAIVRVKTRRTCQSMRVAPLVVATQHNRAGGGRQYRETEMDDAFGPAMTSMAAAALFWIVLRFAVAGSPLRWSIAAAIGEKAFRGLFSLLSLAGLVWLIVAYGAATRMDSFYGIRVVEDWMFWAPAVLMAPALVLFVGSVSTPNPTMVEGERHLA